MENRSPAICLVLLTIAACNMSQTTAVSFNFSSFSPNTMGINYSGDAFPSLGVIQLTKNQALDTLQRSVGRAFYGKSIPLWDASSKIVSNFSTHFRFIIKGLDDSHYGDGLTFFLAPEGSHIPDNSEGGFLGLFNATNDGTPSNQIVAVEFDTFMNGWDPSPNHLGIDVNGIESVAYQTWNVSLRNGTTGDAWIQYDGGLKRLWVYVSYTGDASKPPEKPNLSYDVDLSKFLPQRVTVGFSAATGLSTELHNIVCWAFNSSTDDPTKRHRFNKTVIVVVVVIVCLCLAVLCVGTVCYAKRKQAAGSADYPDVQVEIDRRFAHGAPRKFSYKELSAATKSFSETEKLGQGGFGGVYRGVLEDSKQVVAVKRVSPGSQQGRKEYVAEVTIIGRLRHRNLVQLLGWCHEKGELLLVYEHMPNGSLDKHLYGYGGKEGDAVVLDWGRRYKIACGLASALLYLHEEWEQCVVHRDVKSSNVMLDSNFSARLGDFGLARLVQHDQMSQTTVIAGTMGYLAPECVMTGKASAESDVFSFGAVALEIACGRRPIDAKLEGYKVRLVDWVWDLYGQGRLREAADERLGLDYKEEEMEVLMVLGLWCSHPDQSARPTIRQVLQILMFEAPLPRLPSKVPVPTYTPLLQSFFSPFDTNTTATSSSNSASSGGQAPSKPLLNRSPTPA